MTFEIKYFQYLYATGWTVRGSNSGGRDIFLTRPDRPWNPPGCLSKGCQVSFSGAKRPGSSVNHPLPSSTEVKERVDLNFYFTVNKEVQLYATVCRHLFTAKSLYMFRASQHPPSGVLKTVTATSGIGHNTGTGTSFQGGLIRPAWKEVAVPVL